MEKEPELVQVHQVYKEKDGELEVIPFFVDFASAMVSFAPVGRSSEDRAKTSDFLKRFDLLGPVSSMAEKQLKREDNPPKEENNALSLVEVNKAVRAAKAEEPRSVLAHPKAK